MKPPRLPFLRLLRYSVPPASFHIPSPNPPTREDIPAALPESLDEALSVLAAIFHAPKNKDYVVRELLLGRTRCAVLHIDGMTSRVDLEDVALRALQKAPPLVRAPKDYAKELLETVLPTGTGQLETDPQAVARFILLGNFAVLLDGCPCAVLCEMQGFSTRGVQQPVTESVILGPHQAFNENMRTNLSMLRRMVKSPDLITEFVSVGKKGNTPLALCYMENLTNEALIAEVRRRVAAIQSDMVFSAGELAQLIEDRPFALLPQLLLTERPDRAASFLLDGAVLLVYDNSPHVIAAPATLAAFFHTSEDHSLRWQYGSFNRLIRFAGVLIALFLPSLYNAMLLFHQELLPPELLTSLLEGHAMVPFSVTLELLLMQLVFDLINEASIRMPGYMGSTLGIIGALVLGQAAVSANLISPALIIIVSITGLGTFALPDYSLSIALRIRRALYVVISAFFGFAGIAALLTLFVFCDCALESFGVPVFAPFAPKSRHNPDLILRFPLFWQRYVPPMFRPRQVVRTESTRSWQAKGGNRS